MRTGNSKLHIAFDIDFTITTGDNHQKVFSRKYPGFDINKHYDIYPIEESLIRHGFEQRGFDWRRIYEQFRHELFGVSPLELWFMHVYQHIKDNPNIEIHFITARSQECEELTKELFNHYNIPLKNLYHIGGYHKEELVEELGISIIFEDNLSTVIRILETSPTCHTFLINRLYNRAEVEHPRLHRIDPKDNPDKVLSNVKSVINHLMEGKK